MEKIKNQEVETPEVPGVPEEEEEEEKEEDEGGVEVAPDEE